MPDAGPTYQLARFVEELSFSDLPKDVVRKTKECVLDTLAAILAGVPENSTKIMAKFVQRISAEAESSLVGFDAKAPSYLAALVNGVAAHGAEFDDFHSRSAVHPGCMVLPAALAEAERIDAKGADFLVSVLAGYEVMIRVGLGCLGTGFDRGFHPTGTCGPFGAAAAAAKILGMDAKQTSNAFGLVGSQAGGLMQFMLSGSWVKRLHAGWTALTGVMSSRMARDGYTGPIDVLEGKYGYCRAYSTKYDTTAITRDLGKVYETLKVQPKVYPCCSELFSPIDAALGIMKENRLEPSDVQRIDVRGISIATDFCYNPREKKTRPATNVDAQFSLPFAVATAIHHQRASLPEFSSEEIMNEQVLQLADKVYATLDQELNAMFPGRAPAIVKITTRSGKSFAARVNDSKGTPENPMNHKELEEKFRICSAAASMSHETAEEVIRTVANLEDLQSVKMLTKMLSAWKA